jgi:hypothetical protein
MRLESAPARGLPAIAFTESSVTWPVMSTVTVPGDALTLLDVSVALYWNVTDAVVVPESVSVA